MPNSLNISATAHGTNYLPEYYAAASGGLAELGLTVEAKLCDPWTGVLDDLADGTADIALGGLWVPAMYAGMGRELVVVGQLNARFPMVVVTREPVEGFEWGWTRGRTVLVPGTGGTAMYEFTAGLMREAGVDPAATRFGRDLSTEMYAELFVQGLGDALVADMLTATTLQHRGVGYMTCKLAQAGGPMANSVYYTRRESLEGLQDRLARFFAVISQAMAELNSGTANTASLLAAEWPGVEPAILRDATAELIASDTWSSVRVDPDACERWISILRDAGLVTRDVTYQELVDTSAVDAAELLEVA
jgi:NitT/TauT family transport system substrate-binding protein